MSPSAPAAPEIAFTLDLGKALLGLGVAAPTLEQALDRVAAHLGLEATVYATPTGILASLRKPGLPGGTFLIRAGQSATSLEQLADAEALVDQVIAGRVGLAEAIARLERIRTRPPRFGAGAQVAAHGAASLGMAVVLGGGWREAALAFLVGLAVGGVALGFGRRSHQAVLVPLLGGMASALGGIALGHAVPALSQPVVILSGVIVLLPGLGLLASMQELGGGHLVAGTSRLVGTGFILMLMAFGVALGQSLGAGWYGGLPRHPAGLPPLALAPALALVALGFLVVFQSTWKDYGWTLAASALGYGSARLATQALGPEAGAGIAALALGAVCNHYARRTRRPGAVLLLPALMLVLPGSMGLRGLLMVLHKHTVEGFQAGFQSLTVTVAMMLGLLLANTLVARRSF